MAKFILIAIFASLGLLVSGRSLESYAPGEENFALGVDANGHPLNEPFEDDGSKGGTTKLDPMAQCLWDWIKCWTSNPRNSTRCGWVYSECVEKVKKQQSFRDAKNECLWDLLVCWNKREISSSKCGFIYSDCIERAKKGLPSTDAPPTDVPPPPPTDE
ncbi:uncharacterized protein LOC135686355 isoform X1 [Rhopilema esculentum]|uniref:uncharacterized protein LOC135686355 isoform X1 n=1 Tax=Rhopilema esculentum TaxID=499914 RepID=UPI0031D248E1